jgi:hypothetical protein
MQFQELCFTLPYCVLPAHKIWLVPPAPSSPHHSWDSLPHPKYLHIHGEEGGYPHAGGYLGHIWSENGWYADASLLTELSNNKRAAAEWNGVEQATVTESTKKNLLHTSPFVYSRNNWHLLRMYSVPVETNVELALSVFLFNQALPAWTLWSQKLPK